MNYGTRAHWTICRECDSAFMNTTENTMGSCDQCRMGHWRVFRSMLHWPIR